MFAMVVGEQISAKNVDCVWRSSKPTATTTTTVAPNLIKLYRYEGSENNSVISGMSRHASVIRPMRAGASWPHPTTWRNDSRKVRVVSTRLASQGLVLDTRRREMRDRQAGRSAMTPSRPGLFVCPNYEAENQQSTFQRSRCDRQVIAI